MMTLREVAALVGGELSGDAAYEIAGINKIELAGPNEVTFLSNPKYAQFLPQTKAGCVLLTKGIATADQMEGKNVIEADDAYRAFVVLMQHFFPAKQMEAGLRSDTAYIHPQAKVAETASIGPGCVVDKEASIAEGVQLYANVVVYPGCSIGADTVIHSNVTCAAGTQIGERCIIHAGVVLGSDGFGFFEKSDGSFEKIPQVGIVQVGNDVEIGANTSVDRAAVGATIIEDGVKLDNLIHIAHGVTIGKDSAMAAQAGISGSTTLGQRNRIAGQVGVVGHIKTVDDVVVQAQSGLSKSVNEPGAYFGSPATTQREALRIHAALQKLPELVRELRELRARVKELSGDEE